MTDQPQPDLGMQVLDEALGIPAQAETEREDAFTPQPEPPRRTGGYQPLIDAKRKELLDLEKKIETQEQTGVYLDKDQGGGSYFNFVRMNQDQMRINKLNREISELRDQQRTMESERERRKQAATQTARTVAQREAQYLPENLRHPTVEVFAGMVQQITADGEWGKPVYADRAKIEAALVQVFNTAIGEAMRRQRAQGGAPAASGLDAEQPKETKPDGEVDDFTNNLMYAYEQKRATRMTVAQLRAAERAKQQGASETGGKA